MKLLSFFFPSYNIVCLPNGKQLYSICFFKKYLASLLHLCVILSWLHPSAFEFVCWEDRRQFFSKPLFSENWSFLPLENIDESNIIYLYLSASFLPIIFFLDIRIVQEYTNIQLYSTPPISSFPSLMSFVVPINNSAPQVICSRWSPCIFFAIRFFPL